MLQNMPQMLLGLWRKDFLAFHFEYLQLQYNTFPFLWSQKTEKARKENDLLHFPHALLSLIKEEETKNLAPPHLFNSSLSLGERKVLEEEETSLHLFKKFLSPSLLFPFLFFFRRRSRTFKKVWGKKGSGGDLIELPLVFSSFSFFFHLREITLVKRTPHAGA